MRITRRLEGSLAAHLRQTLRRAEAVATEEVAKATRGLQADWRNQAQAAGLGRRLANTVRVRIYPPQGASLGAAGYVFTRAPEIMRGHAEGATIRARNGATFLALPTDSVPRARAGRRGSTKRMTPVEVEAAFNRDLRLVVRPGRPALLVMDQLAPSVRRATGQLRGFRGATARRLRSGRGLVSVVMFVLLRQTRLRKKLDLPALAESRRRRLAAALGQRLFREG